MGALHQGHAELLKRARKVNDITVLSIFVNPTQFGPKEDFSTYPRTLESDLALAATEKVDVVFVPKVLDIYPKGHSTSVQETEYTQGLCGEFRPGHFQGVTTVVLKLFNLVRPDRAYFGLKDLQQYLVIRKMVQDLDLNLEVLGVPTVRESDGLAMSSRNRGISPADRKLAPEIYQSLQRVARGESDVAKEITHLTGIGFRVQYYESKNLEAQRFAAVAAYLGSVRLIDNILY
jgi:pantoate--beta-alanine ligase